LIKLVAEIRDDDPRNVAGAAGLEQFVSQQPVEGNLAKNFRWPFPPGYDIVFCVEEVPQVTEASFIQIGKSLGAKAGAVFII